MVRLAPWLFVAACAVFYLGPITEGDFFWHLRAGERIEAGGIPSSLTLPTQWLGQWLLYKIWSMGGAASIVGLRAAAYASALGMLYVWLRREGAGLYISMFLLLFPAVLFMSYPNERPQVFTFVLFPLSVLMLERYRRMGGYWSLAGLGVMWLVWANIHSGFLLSYACAWAYFAGSGIAAIKGRESVNKTVALGALLLAPAALAVLPGVDIKTFALKIWYYLVHTDAYSQSLQENLSPLVAARELGEYYPAYWGFMLLAAAGLYRGLRAGDMPAAHALALTGFMLLSLKSLRFMAYPVMLAPMLARHAGGMLPIKERGLAGPALIVIVLAAWAVVAPPKVRLDVSPEFPREAARFLKSANIGSNVFSYHGWTGYLYWTLPEHRQLMRIEGVTMEMEDAYDKILWADNTEVMGAPQWSKLLDAYGLGVIITPGISPVSGQWFPLMEALLSARNWYLVYTDDVANVYLKDHPKNAETIRLRSLPKANAYLQAVTQTRRYLADEPHRTELWQTLELLYRKLGLTKEAGMAAKHELPAVLR